MPSCSLCHRCSGERPRNWTFIIPETKFGRLKVKPVVVFYSCLLGFMCDSHAETWKGFVFASLLFLLSCLQSLLHHHYMFHCFTVGMRLKTAVMGLVHRKVMSCSPSSVVVLRSQEGLQAGFPHLALVASSQQEGLGFKSPDSSCVDLSVKVPKTMVGLRLRLELTPNA